MSEPTLFSHDDQELMYQIGKALQGDEAAEQFLRIWLAAGLSDDLVRTWRRLTR